MATITRQPGRRRLVSIKPHAVVTRLRLIQSLRAVLHQVHPISWLVLLTVLIFFNVFAHQALLVPQVRDYRPNWYGARWINASDAGGPVAFYRKTISLEAQPGGAFLTVQGSQTYALYVNGRLLDRTQAEFAGGATNLAHIYDVTPFLKTGTNVVALCVVNQDEGLPAARAVLGLALASQLLTFPTDRTWRATANARLVDQPCNLRGNPQWSDQDFNDATWQGASYLTGALPPDGILRINPALFESALPATWLAVGKASDAFFYRSVNLPAVREAWLRLASTGPAQIYLNGRPLAEAPARMARDQNNHAVPTAVRLTAGLYDVSPYLHAGQNDLAVHVTASGFVTTSGSRGTSASAQERPAAILLDLLVTRSDGSLLHIVADNTWRASSISAPGWMTGNGITHWAQAVQSGYTAFTPAAPYRLLATNIQEVDTVSTLAVASIVTLLLLLLCLVGVSVQVIHRASVDACAAALDRVALAFVPALALMSLLYALSLEPLIPRPFPFTLFWMSMLIKVVLLSFALILLVPYLPRSTWRPIAGIPWRLPRGVPLTSLAIYLIVAVLTLVGAYMVTYQLSYESYWQDELASIYAAQGILHHGIPRTISGFIYPKAELFSYMLAAVMAIFGTGPEATRSISAVEYIVSLPLTFFIGRYFLGWRVGLLAMALMVFSPMALRWGREARMYQQAELCTLLVVYLFYRAVQPGARTRYIYLSLIAVIVMYLSHEETFILLPAILFYFLAAKRLSWMRNFHWWFMGLLTMAIILFQFYLSMATHPPILGTDRSQRPFIGFVPENLDFYLRLFFASHTLNHGVLAELGITSTLALGACLGALFSRDRALRYLSFFFFIPLLFLMLTFTLTADRYIYPLLPVFAILAAAALVWLVDMIARFARLRLTPFIRRILITTCTALLIGTMLIAQIPALSNFGLAASRTLGVPYHHRYPDYQRAGNYIRAHWQPGDVLLVVAPATDGAFYVSPPAYTLYRDRALYVFESNGHIVDTLVGSIHLLNRQDFEAMLAKYHRIWVFAVSRYQCCEDRFPILENFRLVFEGQDTIVYFRSD